MSNLRKQLCSGGKFLCGDVFAGAVICYAFGYEVADDGIYPCGDFMTKNITHEQLEIRELTIDD